MKGFVICVVLVLVSVIGFGQSQEELSSKYQKKLDKISDPYKRKLKYNKYYLKDSLYQAKQALKKQALIKSKKVLKDSLVNIPVVAEHQSEIDEIINLDSAAVKKKGIDIEKRTIADQAGIELSSIPTDSITIFNKASEFGEGVLEDETNIELPSIPTDSAGISYNVRELGNNILKGATGVELSDIPMDSTQIKNALAEKSKERIAETTGVDMSDLSLDSTTVDNVKKIVGDKGEEYLKNSDEYDLLNGQGKDPELIKLTEQKKALEKAQAEIKETAMKNELKKKMIAQAKNYVVENFDKLQEAQTKMTDLKKKYSSVPNSNDLSTATKHKSLKGESFWKRLVLGGNFNISKTNPVNLDLSPVMGYRINKLFEAGISATYRVSFKASSTVTQDKAIYGQGLWANHLFYKNYFGYLEGERMSTVTAQNDMDVRSWKESLFVGVGRKFKIAKWMEMQALVVFNFLYDNKDELYASPVVFKTGFRINP